VGNGGRLTSAEAGGVETKGAGFGAWARRAHPAMNPATLVEAIHTRNAVRMSLIGPSLSGARVRLERSSAWDQDRAIRLYEDQPPVL
jgi:hypothetical protein